MKRKNITHSLVSAKKRAETNIPQMQAACIRNGVTYSEIENNLFRFQKEGYSTVDYSAAFNRIKFHDKNDSLELKIEIRNFITLHFNSKEQC